MFSRETTENLGIYININCSIKQHSFLVKRKIKLSLTYPCKENTNGDHVYGEKGVHSLCTIDNLIANMHECLQFVYPNDPSGFRFYQIDIKLHMSIYS